MVGRTGCSGVHIGEQHTGHMMLTGKRVVVVEMTVPTDGLAVFSVSHRHVTRYHFVVLLCKRHDGVLGVVVTPCRNEYGILVIISTAVVGSIVDREQGLE